MLKLRNHDEEQVEIELNDLEQEKFQLQQLAEIRWLDFIYVRALRRPLIVTIVIQMTQQFSGKFV